MPFYGKLFLFCRAVIRLLNPRFRLVHAERVEEPAVFVCRHSDIHGIFMTLPWLPVPVHTWGLQVFADVQTSYRHLREITFMGRYGWPRWFATITARLASWGLAALYQSARVIPVYRGSVQIRKTFQLSVDALKHGRSLLIFPDKDYASSDSDVTDLYDGFLRLDRFYHRSTGRHIPFIPLFADRKQRTLTICEPLRFTSSTGEEADTTRLINLLKDRLSGHLGGLTESL